jgi:hypothetical protein
MGLSDGIVTVWLVSLAVLIADWLGAGIPLWIVNLSWVIILLGVIPVLIIIGLAILVVLAD